VCRARSMVASHAQRAVQYASPADPAGSYTAMGRAVLHPCQRRLPARVTTGDAMPRSMPGASLTTSKGRLISTCICASKDIPFQQELGSAGYTTSPQVFPKQCERQKYSSPVVRGSGTSVYMVRRDMWESTFLSRQHASASDLPRPDDPWSRPRSCIVRHRWKERIVARITLRCILYHGPSPRRYSMISLSLSQTCI
jgi:hypothetical protein